MIDGLLSLDGLRVIFQKGKQKQLLALSKQMSRLTWDDYASAIGASCYGVLRASYLNEHSSLPLAMLDGVLQFVNNGDWKSWIVEFREQHWGQAKGGAASLKAWHARMRQHSARYHEVQSNRFRQSRVYKYRTSAGYEVRSLYELVMAENLIVNLVPHQYERILRCGPRIFFPDFFIQGNRGTVLIEICGFPSKQNWKRLLEKLDIYKEHKVADVLVVIYRRQKSLKTTLDQRFDGTVRFIAMDEIDEIAATLQQSYSSRPITIVTESEALRRCSRIQGKQIHWQRLLSRLPKEVWIETLASCGVPEFEVRRIRRIEGRKTRLLEATRLATKLGFVPREALVEMIAGTYNGAAGDYFGSMSALVRLAESPILERFT